MSARDTGQSAATQLLAQLLASIQADTGADIIAVDNGVAAHLFLASGDRYIVVVQWQGDNEA